MQEVTILRRRKVKAMLIKNAKKNNVNDTENMPVGRENRVDLNDSTLIPESGCGSPVKENTQKASRKRLRKPETWYKNTKIKDKIFGRQYLSKNSKGEMVPRRARRPGPPCKCKDKCYVKVGLQNVQKLFNGYYEIPTNNCKNQYLSNLITKKPTQNQLLYGSENKSRVAFTFTYYVIVDGNKIRVCKIAFLNIHDIGKDKVENVVAKINPNGIVEPDQRGKHQHHNQVPEEMKALVHEYIQSVPVKRNHYTRTQNPHKQYMDIPNKETQTWLYVRYCEWLAETHPEAQPVKKSYFLEIYNTKYNIEIRRPKVDTCDTCHRLE